MPAGSRTIGLRGAACGLALALTFAAPAAATFPGANGRIAFRDASGSDMGFRTIAPDGSDERLVPIDLPGVSDVTWSADGARVAFSASTGEPWGAPDSGLTATAVYTANADGTDVRRITPEPVSNWAPAWSPDGQWLVYQSIRSPSAPTELTVARADGSAPRVIAESNSSSTEWAPDGTGIAYATENDLLMVPPEGGPPSTVAHFDNGLRTFSFSPDGRTLVMDVNGPADCIGGCQEIWRVRADGTGRTRVLAPAGANGDEYLSEPVWSPDGSTVAFCRYFSESEARTGLWAMGPDGRNLRRLGPVGCAGDWQPLPPQAPAPLPPSEAPETPAIPPGPLDPSDGPCAAEQIGTPGADRLVGTAGGDSLDGGGAGDRLLGLDGVDCLFGRDGDDHLDGGAGDDDLDGAAGRDVLLGRDGRDVLSGGPGRDRLDGGRGADILRGGPAYDILRAGPGDDRIDVRGGQADTVDCGTGRDLVRASASDRVRRNCERVVRTRR